MAERAAGNGSRTTPSFRMAGAQPSAFDMNSTGWTADHARRLPATARSMPSPCTPWSTQARRTPARSASATSSGAVSSGAYCAPWKPMKCTPVTPSRAGATVSGLVRSPPTTSTPAGRRASSGCRVRARTRWPPRSSSSTTARPTLPVAPVTRYVISCSSAGYVPPGASRSGRLVTHPRSEKGTILSYCEPWQRRGAPDDAPAAPDAPCARKEQADGGGRRPSS